MVFSESKRKPGLSFTLLFKKCNLSQLKNELLKTTDLMSLKDGDSILRCTASPSHPQMQTVPSFPDRREELGAGATPAGLSLSVSSSPLASDLTISGTSKLLMVGIL